MGAILAVAAVGAPFLFIEQLSGDLLNPTSLALLAGGMAVLALFVVVERRAPRPLLDLSLFQSRAFICGSIAAAFYFVAAVSCYFLLVLHAQIVLGLSPLMAGVLLVPLSLVLTVSSLAVGRLAGRLRARTLSTAGMLCISGGLLGLSFLGPRASYAEILWPLLILGLGGGLFHPPNNSATLNIVPAEHLSVANGFLSTPETSDRRSGRRSRRRSSRRDSDRRARRRHWRDLLVRSLAETTSSPFCRRSSSLFGWLPRSDWSVL
jgi:predicted MFS family arabinose efflux permease